MCTCKVLISIMALVCGVQAQYQGYPDNSITQRAADRQRYETELKVSCDTGDDRACFELFLSLNRVYLAISAGVLGFVILVSLCIWCCCCCRRKHHRLGTSSRA